MDSNLISKISRQVFHDFPEVKESSPRVQAQGENFLLIFKGSAKTSDGRTIPRVVRVVANAKGDILKITTSR
jgi:hypothetical protein